MPGGPHTCNEPALNTFPLWDASTTNPPTPLSTCLPPAHYDDTEATTRFCCTSCINSSMVSLASCSAASEIRCSSSLYWLGYVLRPTAASSYMVWRHFSVPRLFPPTLESHLLYSHWPSPIMWPYL